MLSMTNPEKQIMKPIDLPVSKFVYSEKPLIEQEQQQPEFELTPLNPKL
ncbi:hypothetical protein [Fictibacillus barbaricus]|uniref:Uncharacterized protein n=1 Tax=Fictibacillus barbaricus TaxID=182136 RepID=A0ABU1TWS1_9BACL|nr:hypothetical protein [Fictibacillus barbaricus]MDR7071672.1 hypothetical protein [Fictibacillus barbaricus]